MGQVFLAVSGCVTLIQLYKVQEAAGNGAAALVDEVVGGTSEAFGSILSGINNNVKVSMLVIGICFVGGMIIGSMMVKFCPMWLKVS